MYKIIISARYLAKKKLNSKDNTAAFCQFAIKSIIFCFINILGSFFRSSFGLVLLVLFVFFCVFFLLYAVSSWREAAVGHWRATGKNIKFTYFRPMMAGSISVAARYLEGFEERLSTCKMSTFTKCPR